MPHPKPETVASRFDERQAARKGGPGSISDVEDMMIDIEREERENRGKVTPAKIGKIRYLTEDFGLTPTQIASHLCLDVSDVEEVVASFSG